VPGDGHKVRQANGGKTGEQFEPPSTAAEICVRLPCHDAASTKTSTRDSLRRLEGSNEDDNAGHCMVGRGFLRPPQTQKAVWARSAAGYEACSFSGADWRGSKSGRPPPSTMLRRSNSPGRELDVVTASGSAESRSERRNSCRGEPRRASRVGHSAGSHGMEKIKKRTIEDPVHCLLRTIAEVFPKVYFTS